MTYENFNHKMPDTHVDVTDIPPLPDGWGGQSSTRSQVLVNFWDTVDRYRDWQESEKRNRILVRCGKTLTAAGFLALNVIAWNDSLAAYDSSPQTISGEIRQIETDQPIIDVAMDGAAAIAEGYTEYVFTPVMGTIADGLGKVAEWLGVWGPVEPAQPIYPMID